MPYEYSLHYTPFRTKLQPIRAIFPPRGVRRKELSRLSARVASHRWLIMPVLFPKGTLMEPSPVKARSPLARMP